jgi:hypothetical protein
MDNLLNAIELYKEEAEKEKEEQDANSKRDRQSWSVTWKSN